MVCRVGGGGCGIKTEEDLGENNKDQNKYVGFCLNKITCYSGPPFHYSLLKATITNSTYIRSIVISFPPPLFTHP